MVSVAAVAVTRHFNSPMTAIGVVVVTAVTVWWLPVRPLLYHKRRFYANEHTPALRTYTRERSFICNITTNEPNPTLR